MPDHHHVQHADEPAASKSPEEKEKLDHEIDKLKEEIKQLKSSNKWYAALGRNIWPIVSGILTIGVSLVALNVSWQTQSFTEDQELSKKFVSALQMATDAKAGQDARI